MSVKTIPLGDMHSGRQTVLVETENEKYIFKPRDYKTEEAFTHFCSKIAEMGLCAFSRPAAVIEILENGHTQAVEENIITDDKGVSLYYKRAGMLLFFCYLFSSSDMHCENIIASGDMPVVIDLETLLSGRVSRAVKGYNLSRSVMCSHLICNFINAGGRAVDVSGLSGRISELANVPHTKNGRVFLWDRYREFLRGFTDAYNFTLLHKPEISSLINVFSKCKFRQILRPTETYRKISDALKRVGEDKKRDTAYTLLSRAYKRDKDPDRLKAVADLLKFEVDSVIKGEIPLFYTLGDGLDIFAEDMQVLNNYLEMSPVNYAQKRLEELSAADLKRQSKIIELAVSASAPLGEKNNVNINTDTLAAGEISARAVINSAVDMLPSVFCGLFTDRSGNVNFTSAGFSLYDGLVGIMCMLAAVYRKTGREAYQDVLMRCFDSFCAGVLNGGSEILLTDSNASLENGIGGMISGLRHAFELTGDKCFFDAALTLIKRIRLCDTEYSTDYLGGIGALPVVLDKFKDHIDNGIFDRLYAVFDGAQAQNTGVAHGASGILLSFSAINTNILSNTLDKSMLSVVKWENSKYCEETGNWYDLRDATKKGFMSGWCSGAPGIGMARKAVLSQGVSGELKAICEQDIARSIGFLERETPTKRDTLCCGSAARIMAASRLSVRVDGIYNALVLAEQTGRLRVFHCADTNDINVSLMQGLSGVAYALSMYNDRLGGGMLI